MFLDILDCILYISLDGSALFIIHIIANNTVQEQQIKTFEAMFPAAMSRNRPTLNLNFNFHQNLIVGLDVYKRQILGIYP